MKQSTYDGQERKKKRYARIYKIGGHFRSIKFKKIKKV